MVRTTSWNSTTSDNPGEQNNAFRELGAEGEVLCERTISFLESVGTLEEYLAPRREALDR